MPLNFELRREKHAIGEFIAKVTFFQAVTPVRFADAMRLAREVANDLNLPAALTVPQIGLSPSGLTFGAQQASGFQRFNELGEPVMALQCDMESISVVIRDYDCWGTTLPLLLDVFTRIGSVYLSEVPAIKSVTVQYLNEFRARTTEVQEAREIFRQGSNWLAPFYIDAKDFWHSHAGIYEPISDNSRFLLNFNADVVSQAFLGESEARLYAKALILSAIHFDILGQSPWVVEENAFLSGLSDRLNDVHRREKQLLAEVISDSYLAVMGEGADEYSRSK